MAHLVLRDPPAPDVGRKRDAADTEWNALLNPAKKKPGRWHQVVPAYDTPGAAATAAYDINRGRNGSLPTGSWEACSVTLWDDNGPSPYLFVKYLGE